MAKARSKSTRKGDDPRWNRLERLRAVFLQERPVRGGSYWSDQELLQLYDETFAERIRWKWLAVLEQLRISGWTPPRGPVMDWGCGTGVAIHAWLSAWGCDAVTRVYLLDASPQAVDYAAERIRAAYPELEVCKLDPSDPLPDPAVLLISHVITELSDDELESLLSIVLRSQAVVWIEPGSFAASRRLCVAREALRSAFTILLPCPHEKQCPILFDENNRDWCHFFAPVPKGVMNDPLWTEFGRRLGIDLRALPYSVLVLDRREPVVLNRHAPCPPGLRLGRVLGRPRVEKGLARFFVCTEEGIRQLILPRRVNPELHHAFGKQGWPTWIAFETDGERLNRCCSLELADHDPPAYQDGAS